MTYTKMQKEILRAIELHGGITPITAQKYGWLNCHGMPMPEFQELVRVHRVVAPRVLTSQPLRMVWQMREKHSDKNTLAMIEKEANRLKMKEYAPGGFRLDVRPELKGRR